MRQQGRIYARGDALWVSWYAHGDRREAVSTLAGKRPGETTYDDAVKVLERRLLEKAIARESRSILPKKVKPLAVAELLEQYQTHRLIQGVKRPVDFAGTIKALGTWWGHLNLAKLTTEDLEREIQQKLAKGFARGTVAQRLHGLYAALRWAHVAKKIQAPEPMPKIRVPLTPTKLWTPAEVEALCADERPWFVDIVRFGHLTGWRVSECLDLSWDRVDSKRGLLYLDDTKTDDPRVRPIEASMAALLARRTAARRLGCALVFHVDGLPVGDDLFHRRFRAACLRAGLGARRFHAFRHSAYDRLQNNGVDLFDAQNLIGHKSLSSARRYAKPNIERMRLALERSEADTHSAVTAVLPISR